MFYCLQLALQLGDRICYTLPCRRRAKCSGTQSKGVLYLERLLLIVFHICVYVYLRDKGVDTGAG